MSEKFNGVNHSMRVPNRGRRITALKRLEESLKSGSKNDKEGNKVPLTETDKKRYNKEIAILKKRI